MADNTRTCVFEFPVQNNTGMGRHFFLYDAEWFSLGRTIINAKNDICFNQIDKISIILRIGGKFSDFGGGYGVERVRISRKKRYITCDMVVQHSALAAQPVSDVRQIVKRDMYSCFLKMSLHKDLTADAENRNKLLKFLERFFGSEAYLSEID